MSRQTKREQDRVLNSIIHKAKLDMEKWILTLPTIPSEIEIKAFQAGYIAGINRGSNLK